MKVRTGFVSNSSCSSFCIFGVRVGNWDELIEKWRGMGMLIDEWSCDDHCELLEKVVRHARDGGCNSNIIYISICDDYYYVGRSYDTIGDEETGAQLKESVKEFLAKYFSDDAVKKCGHIEEAWRDG